MKLTTMDIESWAWLLGVIFFAFTPLVIGLIVMKIYRYFIPLEKQEYEGIARIGENMGDGFLKTLFVGWCIFGPVFFGFYYFYR